MGNNNTTMPLILGFSTEMKKVVQGVRFELTYPFGTGS
jgi:hypothetical protein